MSKNTIETKDMIYTAETEIHTYDTIHPKLNENSKWRYECICGEEYDWEYNPPVETFDRREYYEDGEYSDLTKLICVNCRKDIPESEKDKMYNAEYGPFNYLRRTTYTKKNRATGASEMISREEFEKAIKEICEKQEKEQAK